MASDGGMASCPDGFECLALGLNPSNIAASFDDIGHALISVLQVMTFANWTDLMYSVQDVHSFWVFVYFVTLAFVGPLLCIQLFLVVISSKFTETKEAVFIFVSKVGESDANKSSVLHALAASRNVCALVVSA